jgi:arginase
MVLRAALGEGEPALSIPAGTIRPDRVIVAAARSFDDAELEAVQSLGITTVSVDELRDPDALAAAVRATGAAGVFIHIDVDALDPSELAGNARPEPFGVTVGELTAAITRLREEVPLVGSSLAGYSPASLSAAPDDLGAILRIVGALA